MSHAAQAGFQSANDNRRVLISSSNQVAVYSNCSIRTKSHFPARGKCIGSTMLLGNGIMIHHGIHVAGRHKESQPRLTEDGDGSIILPIRLGDKSNLISARFQQSRYDCSTEAWVVHIGIPAHVDKVHLLPASR